MVVPCWMSDGSTTRIRRLSNVVNQGRKAGALLTFNRNSGYTVGNFQHSSPAMYQKAWLKADEKSSMHRTPSLIHIDKTEHKQYEDYR